MIRFGTAGWLYKDWEGIVYPKPRPKGFDPLEFLAGFFNTVEINSTFYHPAKAATAEKWIERVADYPDFRFTAKLWKRFTHERASAWTRAEVREVRAGFDKLNDSGRLGAVLLQFPWSFRRTEENREWLAMLPGRSGCIRRARGQARKLEHSCTLRVADGARHRLREHRSATLQQEHQAKCERYELRGLHPRARPQL